MISQTPLNLFKRTEVNETRTQSEGSRESYEMFTSPQSPRLVLHTLFPHKTSILHICLN